MNAWLSVRRRRLPKRLAADKGYSYTWIRDWLQRRRVQAVIAQRSDQVGRPDGDRGTFDKPTYRRRCAIECCIGWLKECRRAATRYEKLALTYLGMVTLAMGLRLLAAF